MNQAKAYRIRKGGLHDRFFRSRKKLRIFGGGFGNGKTSAACMLALELARLYPGSNGLIARSTYPKLNDTIRKEFIKWCPKEWVKAFPLSKNESNTCTLTNGTMINFRYVAQQGSSEGTTSNLLSATYDWIIIDQMEDPEISYKDFTDLLGRLRGSTPIDSDAPPTTMLGDTSTLPRSGPRWFIGLTNPTRNWVYKKLVKPLHDYSRTKIRTDDLIWDEKANEPAMEIFEGSTYENKDNLPEDFIETLEAIYKGQMRSRFLMGEWGAYEGLVYPMFDPIVHGVDPEWVRRRQQELLNTGFRPSILEAYDHGIAVQACYLYAFVDNSGNVIIADGVYEKEKSIAWLADKIKEIRIDWGVEEGRILADPAIFRRTSGDRATVGVSTAGLFQQEGIMMVRGNNDIMNGIAKVQSYLLPVKGHRHVISGDFPAPHLYVSNHLQWVFDEFAEYYWAKTPDGEAQDKPVDKNDHAMDTIKYLLSRRPMVATLMRKSDGHVPSWMVWNEVQRNTPVRKHRYG